jgi:hypothetical protein
MKCTVQRDRDVSHAFRRGRGGRIDLGSAHHSQRVQPGCGRRQLRHRSRDNRGRPGRGWINSFQITGPHLRGIAVKDCIWEKGANGKWKPEFVPLGSGIVHFAQFFQMVKQSGFHGPLQIHFEYPLGGADDGATELTISQEEVFGAMRRDLRQLRGYLEAAL